MNFQNIKPVERYQFYLDLAFRRAQEKGKQLRMVKLTGGRLEKSRYIELMKMQVISDTLVSRMDAIGKNFPSIDNLPLFYQELIPLVTDLGQLKKSLAAVNWLKKAVSKFFVNYKGKLKRSRFDALAGTKREFLGRISSLVKQVKSDFVFLEESRRKFRAFPDIRDGMKTAAIAGFPNVGKTTLLWHLTGSKAEIASYPFTTKAINVSYADDLQVLDTPGTLDRFEKMNPIEKIAYLAIKHYAGIIVYVFDLTEPYPLEKQIQLYKRIEKDFNPQKLIIYCSKSDILPSATLQDFKKKFPAAVSSTEALASLLKKKDD